MCQTLAQLRCQLPSTLRATQGDGQGFNLIGQLIEACRFGGEGEIIQVTQLLALGNTHTAWPKQKQVGLQAEQTLHVQLPVAAHRRHVGKLR